MMLENTIITVNTASTVNPTFTVISLILAVLVFITSSFYSATKAALYNMYTAYLNCENFWIFKGTQEPEKNKEQAARLLQHANFLKSLYEKNCLITICSLLSVFGVAGSAIILFCRSFLTVSSSFLYDHYMALVLIFIVTLISFISLLFGDYKIWLSTIVSVLKVMILPIVILLFSFYYTILVLIPIGFSFFCIALAVCILQDDLVLEFVKRIIGFRFQLNLDLHKASKTKKELMELKKYKERLEKEKEKEKENLEGEINQKKKELENCGICKEEKKILDPSHETEIVEKLMKWSLLNPYRGDLRLRDLKKKICDSRCGNCPDWFEENEGVAIV